MVNSRRNKPPAGTFFFTANIRNRKSTLLTDHVTELRQAFAHTMKKTPFRIDAIVILPDHIHTVWTLPPNDDNYSGRWRMIKSHFTRALVNKSEPFVKNEKGEYAIWQRHFWEHTIRDDMDLQRHIEYMHFNSVKHGWVTQAKDWPHSSFYKYVRAGVYHLDWAGDMRCDDESYGERL